MNNKNIYFKVLKHIRMIGTPPPKIWWIPPSGLRVCLRNALRTLEIPIVSIINLLEQLGRLL
jgi:hypothetical protein